MLVKGEVGVSCYEYLPFTVLQTHNIAVPHLVGISENKFTDV
jgi:hypothetical protein